MELQYVNGISAEDFNRLRVSVGWREIPIRQARIGLKNTAYQVAVLDGNTPIAMARVLWDGGYTAYLADVVVDPAYQKKGIARTMIDCIFDHIRAGMEPGEKVTVHLTAAKGKEPFYLRLGFEENPTEQSGAGMAKSILT